jgi:hypothetical protein
MVRWWLEKSGRSRDELQEIGRMIWPEIASEHPGRRVLTPRCRATTQGHTNTRGRGQ